MERLKTILREPLLQFLLIGLGLFLLHARITPRGERLRIVVDRARVDGLSSQYEATWGRPPTSDELAALVDGWVREEIAFREGVELGLDRDDPVIRRRVRQKLEVMAEEGDAAWTVVSGVKAAKSSSVRRIFNMGATLSARRKSGKRELAPLTARRGA